MKQLVLTNKAILFYRIRTFFSSFKKSYVRWFKFFKIPFTKKIWRRKKKAIPSFRLFVWQKLKYFFLGMIFSSVFVFFPIITFVLFQTLPSPAQLSLDQIPQTTKIFDRHGVLLYQFYASQNRTLIPLADIPLNLRNATIAIEDKNFYKNPGFDITAIIRAAIADISNKNLQGGSTITQQLIKSSLLTPERSWSRKTEEIILAFWT